MMLYLLRVIAVTIACFVAGHLFAALIGRGGEMPLVFSGLFLTAALLAMTEAPQPRKNDQ